MAYVPGLVMRRAADLYPGEAKTDRRDAYVLADTGRTKRKKVHWLDASSDELLASLRVLNGYDVDLATDQTRLISRLRDALTAIAPALERAVGKRLHQPGVRDLLTAYPTLTVYAGRIVEIGPAHMLFPQPMHPYTRGLLAAVPTPERAELLTGIDGQQPQPGRRGAGCSFAPRCGLAIDQCTKHPPEPVFLTGRTVRCIRVTDPRAQTTERPGLPVSLVPPPGAAALSLRGLSAWHGSAQALAGIELDVPPQSCVAVVGESGSGKTTLARCITGLHPNGTGEMTFYGDSLPWGIRQRPLPVLKRIQYIFQNPYTSLNPRKTIGQIVAQPLEQFGKLSRDERTARVVKVLRDVSLGSGFLARYPDQLSGGERQRVAIARALVVEPDLLVCDEVTSALDVSVQAIIIELLRGIQRDRQLAMVFITHNLALVRSIAQSAVVLRHGEMVESGPVARVLEHPASPYTAQLMEDVPKLAAAR